MKDLAESAHGQCVRPSAGGGEAAGRLPRSAAELTPRLVRPLTDADNVSLRTAAAGAVWELERSPEIVVPLLERLLDHHRNFDAIDLAGRIGPPAAAVLPRLRQILNEQVERNARNEQNDSAVLNDSWTLVHVASALWDMGGDDEADVVVPALLNAWRDNDSTACDVVACLDRMGSAARPALAGRPAPGTGHGRQARGKEEAPQLRSADHFLCSSSSRRARAGRRASRRPENPQVGARFEAHTGVGDRKASPDERPAGSFRAGRSRVLPGDRGPVPRQGLRAGRGTGAGPVRALGAVHQRRPPRMSDIV